MLPGLILCLLLPGCFCSPFDAFVRMTDTSWIPRKLDLILPYAPGPHACILMCHDVPHCVGGHFWKDTGKCALSLDSKRRRMLYKRGSQTANDFVFGLFCDPKAGVKIVKGGWIADNNDKTYSNIKSLAQCEAKCWAFDWCYSADVDLYGSSKCFLAAVDEGVITVQITSKAGFYQAMKKC